MIDIELPLLIDNYTKGYLPTEREMKYTAKYLIELNTLRAIYKLSWDTFMEIAQGRQPCDYGKDETAWKRLASHAAGAIEEIEKIKEIKNEC